ncbi:connector enhancer of ksr isoform X1 [Colletes latitarsis]|uniref:connector enhancer of ksr isoform X1 n=1 Tax=Colletes latitarsis TaxID=2605962 RepID=UPI0040361462
MAYVNVAEWKTDQVCEWLKGLDNSVLPYVHSFTNHSVSGQQLLSLRPEDLEHLGVIKLGHQEIILEAVEYLRNFHYELDRENLQLLALRLSCQAHSLQNELSRQTDSKPVTTQTLSDVASVITAVKPLVRWLDRPPFSGQLEYNDKKADLMKLALEMATCAQRDRFAEKPIEEIRTICGQLAKLADYIIQDITDPMILQPASLDLATLKKKPGDDLGFYILPSFHGAHQIAEIKFGSAAHQCGKMEEGDEIVQVNYQTVVGWERKNLLELFRESPAEVLLTLKRRPRHTKVYGQIYIKPYRLPSNKKTSYTTRWQHNLPSPRPELLTIPDFTMPLPRHMPKNPSPEPASILDTVNILDTMIIDSSDSDSETEPPLSIRLYSTKPRNSVQRRATITGASPTTKHGIDIEQFWKELKQEHSTTSQLRDKAASCAHGLDNVPSNLRSQTCLSIEQSKRKKKPDGQVDDKKLQFQEKSVKSDVPRIDNTINIIHEAKDECKTIQNCEETLTISNTNNPSQIPQTSINVTNNNNLSDTSVPLDECNNFIRDRHSNSKNILSGKESSICNVKERGKLDKSYSTPAYDLMDTDNVEDRKQKLFCTLESSTNNVSNVSTTKTDIQLVSTNLGDQQKLRNIDDKKQSTRANLDTNVQNVTGIDMHIVQNNDEQYVEKSQYLDSHKTFVCKATDVSHGSSIKSNQSNNECIISDVNKYDKKNVTNNLNAELENVSKAAFSVKNFTNNSSSSYEINENKVESRNNYVQNNSENNPSLTKFGKIFQTFNCASIEHTKLMEKKSPTASIKETIQIQEPAWTNCDLISTEDDTRTITWNIPQIQICQKTQTKGSIDQGNMIQSCKYVELTKIESNKKLESKSHLIPPDPPPRKYYSKLTSSPLDNSSKVFEDQDKHYASQRPNVRRDLKKPEYCMENYIKSNLNHQEKQDYFDVCNSYTEKPIEFIDEINTLGNECRPSLNVDSLYREYNDKQVKEDKSICNKYEPFVEKFGYTSSGTECHNPESCFQNMDSPDGSCSSKQFQSLEHKSKVYEKEKNLEKGVVNKAMMVARSIGLHGSLSKSSSSSPRSSRKRSILFARKRNISVKDIGIGDLESWLTYRTRGAGGAWAKAWFILKCSSLYRFKTQTSMKADCLIALTGFTVSRAAEVKSRKYAFKVYHTGTVFYFSADTEDSLTLWLDAINKATLGADGHSRNSALFSETDESDGEQKTKLKNAYTAEYKPNLEKSFGSLKKIVRKDSTGYKDHEISGASLDRKYLKFLGTRNHNVPVPTAQFRSYRRVLPTSIPNKKQDSVPNSPDLQMTIAGSTFYGLCASQSTTDMSNSSQDMGDYRRTTDRCLNSRNRRPDELQGFITLEEFMLSQQEDREQITRNRSVSPRMTPLTSDHVLVQHRNFHDNGTVNEQPKIATETYANNDVMHGRNKNNGEIINNSASYGSARHMDNLHTTRQLSGDFDFERNENKGESSKLSIHKRSNELSCVHKKNALDGLSSPQAKPCDSTNFKNVTHEQKQATSLYHNKSDTAEKFDKQTSTVCEYNTNACTYQAQSSNHEISRSYDYYSARNIGNLVEDIKSVPKRLIRNEGCSGSSNDLTYHVYETLQRVKRDANISRKGSFNLTSLNFKFYSSDKHWLDSLRRSDKKDIDYDKTRLKNVAQYQPPPIPTSPFEQEGMTAAFEMHLDKGEQVQKPSRLKNLFGNKSQQKPCTLDLPKETQKTLLGSPRLHRALFREKCYNQSRLPSRSNSQSPGDSGISQSVSSFSGNSPQTLSQSFSSVSSVSDWSPDTPSPCTPNLTTKSGASHSLSQKGFTNTGRHSLNPPTLPYIPPPTSPPPDYPGLEYPPVFEPGTYSLLDASLLRNRNKNNRDTH